MYKICHILDQNLRSKHIDERYISCLFCREGGLVDIQWEYPLLKPIMNVKRRGIPTLHVINTADLFIKII